MAEFKKVAEASAVPPGKSISVECAGKTLAVFNVGGTFHVLDDACPHAAAPLSEGDVEGRVLQCPWHGATFEITTGKRLTGPASKDVVCYRARQSGGAIEVELP